MYPPDLPTVARVVHLLGGSGSFSVNGGCGRGLVWASRLQVTVRKDTRTFTKPAKEDPAWTLWAKPRRRAASDRAPSVRRGPDELGSPPASRLSSRPVLRPGVTRRWLRQGGSLFSACPAEARPLLSGGVTRTSRAPHAPRSDGGPGTRFWSKTGRQPLAPESVGFSWLGKVDREAFLPCHG